MKRLKRIDSGARKASHCEPRPQPNALAPEEPNIYRHRQPIRIPKLRRGDMFQLGAQTSCLLARHAIYIRASGRES